MTKHARYSGSNAHRFPACPGQPRLALTVEPLPENEHQAAGTYAHKILSDCLKHSLLDVELLNPYPPPPKETLDAVQMGLSYIDNLWEMHDDLIVQSERTIPFPQNLVGKDDAGGTVDVLLTSASRRKAWVIDFKYGVGETVDVKDNPQLLWYATSACWGLSLDEIVCVIIQPRSFMYDKIREWVITPYQIAVFQADMEEAIERSEAPDAPLIPGDHCEWCPCGIVCLARERYALEAATGGDTKLIKDGYTVALPQPADVDYDRIKFILDHADQLRKWLKDVEAFAFAKARQGVQIPGYKIVETQAKRTWDGNPADTAEKLIALSPAHITIDQVMPRQLVGIGAAEKLLLNGLTKEEKVEVKKAMAELMTKDTSGNLTLVPESDKRQAWKSAQTNFAGVVIDAIPEE